MASGKKSGNSVGTTSVAASPGERDPNDTVYPLHEFDDSPVNRIMMHSMLQFDAVLDMNMLRNSLTSLLSQGDWRKLGGRLFLRKDDKLEIHSPPKYTEQRPPFQWSTEAFNMTIDQHPLGSLLPKARGKAELFPGKTSQFNPLTISPKWATDFPAHIANQEPIWGIHVALFKDATLLSLRWAHVVCDYMGLKGLLMGWTMALQNRWEDVPDFVGAYEDPLKRVGETKPEEPYVLADMQLTPDAWARTFQTYMEHIKHYPRPHRRMLVLPDWAVQKIKSDRTGFSPSDTLEVLPKGLIFNGQFASDSDVLAAWAARLSTDILPAKDRPVLLTGMYETRGALPDVFPRRTDKPDSSPVFVGNATFSTFTNTNLSTIRERPLAETALLVRQAVAEQTKPKQIHAFLHRIREMYAESPDDPAVFAAENSFFLVSSNFGKIDFFKSVDFGPAVVSTPDNARKASSGAVAFHQWYNLELTEHMRNMWAFGGRDRDANVFVMVLLPDAGWAIVEKHLAELSSGEEWRSTGKDNSLPVSKGSTVARRSKL